VSNSSRGGGNPTTLNRKPEVKARPGKVAKRFSKPSPRRSSGDHVLGNAATANEEPVACWFCEERTEAVFVYRASLWRVACGHCRYEGPMRHDKRLAIEAHNNPAAMKERTDEK